MEKLNNLYQWLDKKGVLLFDRQLPFSNGQTKAVTVQLKENSAWGIFMDLGRMETKSEEYSAVLHESGHYATGATHQMNSPYDLVEKHENKADKWAVEHLLSESDLDAAVADGNTELWQLAERFGVTEDLMKKAVCWYTYGNLATELYF